MRTLLTTTGLIALGVAGRLLPHLPNATPMTAISILAGRSGGVAGSMLVPLAAVVISDLILGWYDWRILASVYLSFACIGLMGYVLRARRGALPTALAVLSGSLLFFLVTNAAVWAFSPWYEKSVWGLLYAYELGLPFLRNMLVGDLVYAVALFGGYEYARHIFTRLRAAKKYCKPAGYGYTD